MHRRCAPHAVEAATLQRATGGGGSSLPGRCEKAESRLSRAEERGLLRSSSTHVLLLRAPGPGPRSVLTWCQRWAGGGYICSPTSVAGLPGALGAGHGRPAPACTAQVSAAAGHTRSGRLRGRLRGTRVPGGPHRSGQPRRQALEDSRTCFQGRCEGGAGLLVGWPAFYPIPILLLPEATSWG